MKKSLLGRQAVLLSFGMALIVPAVSFAQNCPMPHAKYWELLSSLDRFTQTIKKGPECQSLSDQLTDLKVFYSSDNRKLVDKAIEVVEGSSGKRVELSVDELKRLSNYSSDVTRKIGTIVASLTDQTGCIQNKKASSLQTLAAITQEAGALSAAFSGPYGVIVQTGGAVISGILRGLDALFSLFKDPYDFSRSQDRMLFVTNLCTYHNIREEIENLVSPESLIETYGELVKALAIKKDKLIQNHSTARQYSDLYTL